jgi:hypothetical protein
VIEDSSKHFLPADFQSAAATLVLDASGTFVATEIPEEMAPRLDDPNRRDLRLDTGSGDWQLVAREGKQQVQLNFRTMQGDRDVPFGTQMNVSNGWSVSLYYFLGDLDEGRRLSFI